MKEMKVGVEAEFILLNPKGEPIVPPRTWDRDDFPILGEIRGEPGSAVEETVANFIKRKIEIQRSIKKGHSMEFPDVQRVPLKTYQAAMKESDQGKADLFAGRIKNIYGIDISEFSDQILDKGKIQGVRASCGLHLHFSCGEVETKIAEQCHYHPVRFPLGISGIQMDESRPWMAPQLTLFNKVGGLYKDETTVRASILTRPAIVHIVRTLDQEFFDALAPAEKNRTKYRQPGFFELKPYGFEYRSLPANAKSLEKLPEIVTRCFELMEGLHSWSDEISHDEVAEQTLSA